MLAVQRSRKCGRRYDTVQVLRSFCHPLEFLIACKLPASNTGEPQRSQRVCGVRLGVKEVHRQAAKV